jgi:hypothetical protein
LVGKRIHNAGVHCKERIKLVSDFYAFGLDTEKESLCIAPERMTAAADFNKVEEFLLCQRAPDHTAGLHPNPFDKHLAAEGGEPLDLHQLRRL